jgi:hypothetical protein
MGKSKLIRVSKNDKREKRGGVKKQRKTKKDPLAPKKPGSSYVLYCNQARPVLKIERPELKGKESLKQLAAQWKKLSPEEKSVYAEDSKKKTEKWKVALDEYKKTKPKSDSESSDSDSEDDRRSKKRSSSKKRKVHKKKSSKKSKRYDSDSDSGSESD